MIPNTDTHSHFMKIVIIGAKGMLGHALMNTFRKFNPMGWDLDDLDITNQSQVRKKITALKPNLIINAAAYTNVDKAQEETDLAFKVNARGVRNLALAAGEIGAMLIHYSTDYVFSGDSPEGYKESDTPKQAVNIYGESKRAGEIEMLSLMNANKVKGYLIRSSWLFGPDGKNFTQTIISLYKTSPELKVVNDQWGKPTYTFDLADATKKLIDNRYQFGIYHLTNEPKTNWYEFAKGIVAIKFGNDSQKQIIPVDSQAFPRPAKRPRYSILLNTKGPKMRPWKKALKEYIPTL